MNKLLVLTAFVFAVAAANQAFACDWQREAAKAQTIVACDANGCTAVPTQEAATAQEEAPAPQTAQEPAAPTTTVVASGQ